MQVVPKPPLLMSDCVEQCCLQLFAFRDVADDAHKYRPASMRGLAERQFCRKTRAVFTPPGGLKRRILSTRRGVIVTLPQRPIEIVRENVGNDRRDINTRHLLSGVAEEP